MPNFARPKAVFESIERDPYWENVVLYSKLDADPPIDLSKSGHIFTSGSGFVLETSTQKFGVGAADLRGATTNDYVDCPDSEDFTLGGGAFTLEIWHKWNSNVGTTFLASWTDTGNQRGWMFRYNNSTDELELCYSTDGAAGTVLCPGDGGTWTPTNNIWYHFVCQRDEDNIISFFRDGVLLGTKVDGAVFWDSTTTMRIGVATGGFASDGWYDEVRITKGVARYTEEGFTPQLQEFPTTVSTYEDYADPYWDYVVLQTDFDAKTIGGVVDNSSRKHALTVSGATLDTTNFKYGIASGDFGGDTDHISAADSDDWHFDSRDWTIECWIRFDAQPAGADDYVILSQWNNASQRSWIMWVTNGDLFVQYSTTGSDTPIGLGGFAWIPNADQWYHLAANRTGSAWTLYIDGVVVDTTTAAVTLFDSTSTFRIGEAHGVSPATNEQRNIDGVRITKGIGRYPSAFTPPVRAHPTVGSDQHFDAVTALLPLHEAAGSYNDHGPDDIGAASDSGVTTELTVLLFDEVVADLDTTFDGKIIVGDPYWDSVVLLTHLDHVTPIDVGPTGHTLTVNSADRDTGTAKFGASSFGFGSGSDNVSAADHADWDFGTGDFTLECWVRFDADPSSSEDGVFLGQWDETGNQQAWIVLLNNDLFQFTMSTTGSDAVNNTVAWTPAGTTWYHVAVSRVGGFVIMFIDGDELLRFADTSDVFDSSAAMHIGWPVDVTTLTDVEKNIDDVRITKGVGRYTGSFVPPTRPHSSAQLIPLGGVWTIEGWVRYETDPGTANNVVMIAQYNADEDERGWAMDLDNEFLRFIWSTDGTSGTTTQHEVAWNPVADQWYHIAVTRDASDNLDIFIDGVVTSSVEAFTYHDSSAVVTLGEFEHDGAGAVQQYLANWRVTSGVARYTAAFRAPFFSYSPRAVHPKDLGNVHIWYDTSAEGGLQTDDLADVVRLIDLSGNGNHASNSTVSERPTVLDKDDANAIGGRRTIDFDGSTQFLEAAITDFRYDGQDIPQTMAGVIHVSTFPAADSTEVICELANTTDVDPVHAFSTRDTAAVPQWRMFRRDDAAAGSITIDDVTGAETTSPHSFVMVHHGTTVDLWIDGVLEQDGIAFDVGVQTIELLVLGARKAGGTEAQHADFRLGEFVLYDEALDDDAVPILSNYLAAKWIV